MFYVKSFDYKYKCSYLTTQYFFIFFRLLLDKGDLEYWV